MGDDGVFHLASQINSRLVSCEATPLAVKAHKGAVERMGKLRDALLARRAAGIAVDRETVLLLLFAGISITRRVQLQRRASEDTETTDLKVTLALLFVLQVLCTPKRDENADELQELQREDPAPNPETEADGAEGDGVNDENENEGEAEASAPVPRETASSLLIKAWQEISLLDQMNALDKQKKQQKECDEGVRFEKPEEIIRPPEVCRACLDVAVSGIAQNFRADDGHVALANVMRTAELFFHTSSISLAYNLMNATPTREPSRPKDDSFLTLGAVEFVRDANEDENRESLIETIVGAAEAEVGQQVLRDYILSLTLPLGVVGVRRTPLLSREPNRIAAEHYSERVNEAHDAAMLGAEYIYSNAADETHKMAALLAGLSILLTQQKLEQDAALGINETVGGGGTAVDAIRLSDAFGCRVNLPFLATRAPPDTATRMTLLPETQTWIVFRFDKRGKPEILLRQSGFDGLKTACLLMTKQ